jgi:hypothetical protein
MRLPKSFQRHFLALLICSFTTTNFATTFAMSQPDPTFMPNEVLVASAEFKNNSRVQLSLKSNPQTGEGYYSLYLLKATAQGYVKTPVKIDLFHIVSKKSQTPLSFKVFDANQDGKEELLIHLQDDSAIDHIAYYTFNSGTLKPLLQLPCSQFSLSERHVNFQSYNFKYGQNEIKHFELNAKGTLTPDKTQCYEMGVRLGISFDDFKALLGGTAKKQYLKSPKASSEADTRQFQVKNKYGDFIFEGPKQEHAKTPYQLVAMTLNTSGTRGIGTIAVGDRIETLQSFITSRQQSGSPVLSSDFLTREALMKTNLNTIGNQTEVWHFKHQNGVINEIRCELE